MGFLLDPLSAVMLFVVTFVGFWIHVYSVGYMAHEDGFQRYFTYLNLFMGAMLMLVLGNNYVVMFVGWEGVGLCSYLLIGFYYKEEFPPYAGRKAFITNRVGDFGFVLGLFALVAQFGSLKYTEIFPRIAANPSLLTGPGFFGLTLAGFIALCLFIGAMGKSAQIPLYVWLPDAMAGPTPVSALIHAATMVTAGVYMVARSNVIYQLAPGISMFVAIIGAATALFAATIGLVQTDIKKVLAYSTVSQLGYMFLAGRARGVLGGDLPPDDARVLQGSALPRLRLGDPRHGRRAGHAEDGRTEEAHAEDVLDLRDRLGGPRRHPAARGVLLQGRDPALRGGGRALGALRGGPDHSGADGLLHVPRRLHDVPWRVPRHARAGAPSARVAAGDDGPSPGAGRGRGRLGVRGIPGGEVGTSSTTSSSPSSLRSPG